MCGCGRPLIERPGAMTATCAECCSLPNACDCEPVPGQEQDGHELAPLAEIAGQYAAVNWHDAWKAQPVASGIGCKSDRRGSGFMVMLGGSADSFGAVGVGAGGDGAWPQLGGWFEE